MPDFCIIKGKSCQHLKKKGDKYGCTLHRKELMTYKKRSRVMGTYLLVKPCKSCIDADYEGCDLT